MVNYNTNFTNTINNKILTKIYINNDNNYFQKENYSNLYLNFEPKINSLYKILFSIEYNNSELVDF